MKLVIRAEVPISVEGILGALRKIVGDRGRQRALQELQWQRIRESSELFRAGCNQEIWAKEEDALEQLLSIWPGDVSLYVQEIPVPAGLPLSFFPLLAGMSIAETDKWGCETFSPLAWLWLREAGAQSLEALDGKLLRMESSAGIGVIELEESGNKGGFPAVREQRNHAAEHVDEGMMMIQVNLDDSSPEWLAYVMEKCLQAGANDVHFLPVTMKKSRPGTLLQVMCYESQLDALKTILFEETTTFGIRYFPVACHRLARRFVIVRTEWGEVTVKLGYHQGKRVQVAPEYAVCQQVARSTGIALKQVYQQAIQLAYVESDANLPVAKQEEGVSSKNWK